jgi:hypothetical protein
LRISKSISRIYNILSYKDTHPLVAIFKQAKEKHGLIIPRDDQLALKILYEKALKDKSTWSEYIQLLPQQYDQTVS